MALRRRGLAAEVVGYARRDQVRSEACALGAVDSATDHLEEAVRGADLVVLCTPVAQFPALIQGMAPALEPGTIVTDVGSVKEGVEAVAEHSLAGREAHFIGSHPMAGSERTGVGAARADLFEGAVCVVTTTPRSLPEAVSRVRGIWEGVGSRVLTMSGAMHDELVSRSSHLPHLVAAALANYVLSGTHPVEQAQLCATGFRDVTRIASGSPEMWRDIALGNREALLQSLAEFSRYLADFQKALVTEDTEAVLDFFATAKRRRDAWRGPGIRSAAE